MDVKKMIQELEEEQEQIGEALLALKRLDQGRGKRRGRPPAWLAEMRKEQKPATAAKDGKPKKKEGGAAAGPVAMAKSA